MRAPPLISILTLGCKLNLADSDSLSGMFSAAGYGVTDHLCEADAVVINTCSVTATADQKSRKLIRASRRVSPQAPVAVTGCYPATAGDEAVIALGANIVAGTDRAGRETVFAFVADRVAMGNVDGHGIVEQRIKPLRSRAFVEAQRGCNDACSFCVIPRTRGTERSRPPEDVVRDINSVVTAGAREVVVTGTQLGAWGREFAEGGGPARLIAAILRQTEVPRLRFSSLQPQEITPELLALWQDPRLMPHFHLALQSGSDDVLAAMRRRYRTADFLRAVDSIGTTVPDAAITTDVIAGFPGETDADFERTLRVCEEARFARVHGFPFSARERTLGARLSGHLPNSVKRERMARLLALGASLSEQFEGRFLGTVRPVLWEPPHGGPALPGAGCAEGYTDNYIRVRARGQNLANRITPAQLTARVDGVVHARSLAR